MKIRVFYLGIKLRVFAKKKKRKEKGFWIIYGRKNDGERKYFGIGDGLKVKC